MSREIERKDVASTRDRRWKYATADHLLSSGVQRNLKLAHGSLGVQMPRLERHFEARTRLLWGADASVGTATRIPGCSKKTQPLEEIR
eukprot:110078-Chlamydomonas_euryale.AAC.3